MLKEADGVGNYHLTIKDQLHVEMENIKNWKKQNYHKQILGIYSIILIDNTLDHINCIQIEFDHRTIINRVKSKVD